MVNEIVIKAPGINMNSFTSFSDDEPDLRRLIIRRLAKEGIIPPIHPRVIDLCAGDGSVAKILVEQGWIPGNITCVDKFKSAHPLVEGVTWQYWNLRELNRALETSSELPDEVVRHGGAFNLVTLSFGFLGHGTEVRLCRFFSDPNGSIVRFPPD